METVATSGFIGIVTKILAPVSINLSGMGYLRQTSLSCRYGFRIWALGYLFKPVVCAKIGGSLHTDHIQPKGSMYPTNGAVGPKYKGSNLLYMIA